MNEMDAFGKLLMEEVRDASVNKWKRILARKMRGRTAALVQEKLDSGVGMADAVSAIVPLVVTSVIHDMLDLIDSEEALSFAWDRVSIVDRDGDLATICSPMRAEYNASTSPIGVKQIPRAG